MLSNVLKSELKKLIGLKCEKLSFTLGTTLLIGFGKSAIDMPEIPNKGLRTYLSWEYKLLVFTRYLLFKNDELVCTDYLDEKTRDEALIIMKGLVGKKVINVYFNIDTLKFGLFFEDDYILHIQILILNEDYECFYYTTLKRLYYVEEKNGEIKVGFEKVNRIYVDELVEYIFKI